MRAPDEIMRPVDLGLTQSEIAFIVAGLDQWCGPARPEPESARLVGFGSLQEMAAGLDRIQDRLATVGQLSRRDWKHVLIATELIFGSDTFGAGVEWETVTGRDEVADLALLRELQRKLVGVCPPRQLD